MRSLEGLVVTAVVDVPSILSFTALRLDAHEVSRAEVPTLNARQIMKNKE